MKTNKTFLVFLAFLSTTFLVKESLANVLTIENKNDKEVDIVVGSIVGPTEKTHEKNMKVPAAGTTTINVSKEEMGNKDKFYVKGKINTLTPGGTCDNLDINKNYKIIFESNVTLGTKCVCEEVNTAPKPAA